MSKLYTTNRVYVFNFLTAVENKTCKRAHKRSFQKRASRGVNAKQHLSVGMGIRLVLETVVPRFGMMLGPDQVLFHLVDFVHISDIHLQVKDVWANGVWNFGSLLFFPLLSETWWRKFLSRFFRLRRIAWCGMGVLRASTLLLRALSGCHPSMTILHLDIGRGCGEREFLLLLKYPILFGWPSLIACLSMQLVSEEAFLIPPCVPGAMRLQKLSFMPWEIVLMQRKFGLWLTCPLLWNSFRWAFMLGSSIMRLANLLLHFAWVCGIFGSWEIDGLLTELKLTLRCMLLKAGWWLCLMLVSIIFPWIAYCIIKNGLVGVILRMVLSR